MTITIYRINYCRGILLCIHTTTNILNAYQYIRKIRADEAVDSDSINLQSSVVVVNDWAEESLNYV